VGRPSTREKLLDCAEGLFAEHGLEGVSPGSDLEGHVSALFDLLTGAFEARITGEPS
jgi:hypothetical protein